MVSKTWRTTAVAAVVSLGLAGCAGSGATSSGPSSPGSAARTKEGALARVATFDIAASGGEVKATVHPLVRSHEHLVLTVDLVAATLPDGADAISTDWFDADTTGAASGGAAFRIIDPSTREIHLPASDADGDLVGEPTSGSLWVTRSGLRLQRVYAAPEDPETDLGLLMPGHYVDDMPIVDAKVPEPTDPDVEPVDLDVVAQAPVLPLESFTRQLDGAVQVAESIDKVEISLSGDVLFATGSHKLTKAAARLIDAAGATLASHSGGVIEVVGHTDDVGDDASNRALSERRAKAVADALRADLDTSAYELKTTGRGEAEPYVANDSDANRQLNRRVVLTLTSEQTKPVNVRTDGALPPFEGGPVATGAKGFQLTSSAGTFRVTAPAARRVDGMLEVSIEATRTDKGEYEVGWVLNLAAGAWTYRGEDTAAGLFPFGPGLVVGTSVVYPLDYNLGTNKSGDQEWRIAGPAEGRAGAAGEQTLRFTALYPDIPGATSITIDNATSASGTSFRLTDVPVE